MATNSDINIILGNRVKATRLQKNITREELAENIDVSSRFLADVEAGKVGVSLSTLKSLCNFLGVTSDYLLNLNDADNTNNEKQEIINRINRVDNRYTSSINKIIIAFTEAIDEKTMLT